MKHSINRVLVFTICLVLLSTISSFGKDSRFPDMTGHWAEKYVDALAEKGIITGMDDGLFHPNLPVSTSEFTTMVIRSHFGDIAPTGGYWASGYLDEALKQEIVLASDLDRPDQPLVRRFAARIGHEALLRAFGEADEADVSAADRLGDLYSCHTCVAHVSQFYTKGIMIGRPDSMFYGDENLTRAEAAIVITKMLDKSMREPQVSGLVLPEPSETGAITPDEALKLLEADSTAQLIDVRSKEEFDTGYIPGSICVPLPDIIDNLAGTDISPDKNTLIIVYCQKGSRSLKAYTALKEAGYTRVFNLGGIEDWPYDIIKTN
ncbi:hypothetical protein FACS1894127_1590 [Clostridia bacterium]|nr:hypothetical protein FACS1894127_1590 [Clostridia bacterium]